MPATSHVARRALIGSQLAGPTTVHVDDGMIVAVEPAPPGQVADVAVLSPGMIDLQVNGVGRTDLITADPDGWHVLSCTLARHGVTSFCPTAITAPLDVLAGFVGRARRAAVALARLATAQPCGAHLEGPFLSPGRAGAHNPAHLVLPSPANVDALLANGAPAIVTMAPELDGGLTAVARLSAAGVRVSTGHSDATARQVDAAATAGATLVTHLYNAQRPLHHREPGVVGRALTDSRVTFGLIADLHHVAPDALRLAFAAAPGRIALVSDSVAAWSAGDNASHPPRLADGTLAGAVALLDQAVRNLIGLGIDPAAVLTAATSTPAAALGCVDRGRLAPGCRADLVSWTTDWQIDRVWIGGAPTPVFMSPHEPPGRS